MTTKPWFCCRPPWTASILILLASCGKKENRAANLDFAAYGDCRHGVEVHRRIAKSLEASGARYLLVSGDLVDAPDDPADWDEFRDITKDLRKRPYYCAPGDHDLGSKNLYEKELGLDRLYFDKLEGDCHIFVLDSNGSFSEGGQLDWLEKTASRSTARHRIAVFHHPPFGIHVRRSGQVEEIRPRIHPLLVKLKFCAAICGHQHSFYTTLRDGVRYVVTAGGGASLYNLDSSLGQQGDQYRKFHHFVGFTFGGSGINARVYDLDGIEDESLAFKVCQHP
ncbi:MAG TPA: metallophosphoesterase [Planctomycetota bacterium]|jgi:3',5'-cyclic AMP phosphodiesterase CpdA|nr:metallophosphoesterase [Planctomycetota bacterium]